MLLPLALLGTLATIPAGSPPPDSIPAAELLRPTPALVALTVSPALATTRIAPEEVVGTTRSTNRAGGRGPERTASAGDAEPQLIEYSDAYFTRLTIHRWASYLTLPLFVGEYVVGQKLLNEGDNSNLRGVHRALAGGIGGLFVVNTVTGGLNAIEAWKDPEGRTRRTLHSALMLLSDAGFVLTAALANSTEREGGQVVAVSNTSHKRMAVASMTTALLGYSIMLPIFGNR